MYKKVKKPHPLLRQTSVSVISMQKKHWGSLDLEELLFEILQGVQDIRIGLVHIANVIGDLCPSAVAAGADTKEHAKRH